VHWRAMASAICQIRGSHNVLKRAPIAQGRCVDQPRISQHHAAQRSFVTRYSCGVEISRWGRCAALDAGTELVSTSADAEPDPFAQKNVYEDDGFARLLIEFMTMKISREVGALSQRAH
jgi:hypothetical protein